METFDLYKDISERTKGDIYIGVVGPVRTGKSTFIKKFMDLMVIPNIEDTNVKERAIDELPQSGSGKSIMTTEPKFIPNEAVGIKINEELEFNVRMIDCVGYVVEGAEGHIDGQEPRMINTPWEEEKMPFVEAAELGTQKVISEHSTIGIVVTTDGSVTDIDRDNYIDVEDRVIEELKSLGKPFVIVLNTNKPYSEETEVLRNELFEKHNVTVIPLNCSQIREEDLHMVLEKILYEFPLKEVRFNLPKWVETLDIEHWLKSDIIQNIGNIINNLVNIESISENIDRLSNSENIKKTYVEKINLGNGNAIVDITLDEPLFYKVLSETTNTDIKNDYELISNIKLLADAKREFDKIAVAIDEVNRSGYGIVSPSLEEMSLGEPELVKHGTKYGVKIKATAPSIHFIKTDIETEISPIVGTEEQSIDLIEYLNNEMNEENLDRVWDLNIFGKTMQELVKDGLQTKLYQMPEEAQIKLQESLQRIVNDGVKIGVMVLV